MSPAGPVTRGPSNRFDRMEWAGAFGDLGTHIPFVVSYLSVSRLEPFGVLLAFGASMLACGLYYRTPFPVQPMKAIGAMAATQAVQTAVVTPHAIRAATLVTGLLWLALALTGLARSIARLVPAAVVAGIVLGLGLAFMLEGVKMMQTDWAVAALAALGGLVLIGNRTIPSMFALLAFGAAVGLVRNPDLATALSQAHVGLPTASFSLEGMQWSDLFVGTVLLALPQVPLTLGNALIAVKEENNRLFPEASVTERQVAMSTGLMNLFSASVGGVPMCHGAGGMAGHVAFGARTGGATIILGSLLLVLAFFFSDSVQVLFHLFPAAVLGVILFITGAQLAIGTSLDTPDRAVRFVTLATAAVCTWNVAIGFVAGIVLEQMRVRGVLRF